MERKIYPIIVTLIIATLSVATLTFPVKAAVSTLVLGTTDSVESAIDPALAYDYFGWEIIQNTGSTLVDVAPGSQAGPNDIIPALATNWSLSPSGLNWTFSLRHGVLYDDNVTEFNATHVKYSFERGIFGINASDGPQYNMDYAGIIGSIDVVSKYEVRFNLLVPFSPFLQLLTCQASSIVNPAYGPYDTIMNYTAGNARASTPMDLGPYMLTEWVRTAGKDSRIVLDANPRYWNASAGVPKMSRIIYNFYSDSTALRLAIEGGDVDIAYRQLSADDIAALETNPNLKVWKGTGAFIQYMIFQEADVTGLTRLNDSRIRRAITAAINRTELVETVFINQSQPLYSMIPAGMMGHTEAFKALGDANYTYTQSLLAELGYNSTNNLQIELWYESSGHYPSSGDQAALYKSQLEASGVISVTLKSADWSSYRLNRNNGIMQVFLYGWYPDYVDPDDYAFLYWAPWLGHHFIDYGEHYTNMLSAYNDARNTTDAATRATLYAQLENYAVQDCPVIPLFQSSAWAVTNKNVSGVVLDISENWRNWIVIPEFPISILIVLLIATLIPLILVRKLPRRQVIVN
jgi:peptide/nickel transport system substrate-binding protein